MTSFRPRPIDVDKPLFIMREELKDEDTRSMPVVSTGMEQHEENVNFFYSLSLLLVYLSIGVIGITDPQCYSGSAEEKHPNRC